MANPRGQPEALAPFKFKPGVSGNPAGRPRKRPQSEANEDFLRAVIPEPWRVAINKITVAGPDGSPRSTKVELLPKGATFADAIALGLGKKAMLGDPACAKELRESVEGRSVQRIELTSPEDRGFEVRVAYEQPPKTIEAEVEKKIIEKAATDAATVSAVVVNQELEADER